VDTLLYVGLANAVLALLMALPVAGFARLCRRPALAHGLWLIVLLRFLTPPLVAVSLPWFFFPGPPTVGSVSPARLLAPAHSPGSAGVLQDGPRTASDRVRDGRSLAPPEPGTGEALRQTDRTRATPAFPSWEFVATTVWLTGSLLWLFIACLRVFRFRRLLRYAVPATAAQQEQARRLAERLGLARCPGLWLVPAAVSPMLWALGRTPRLLVPAALWERLTEEQRGTLLAHELAHFRRRDHWVRRLELVVLCLYWWHPVAWWARREVQAAEEVCCDAWVVWALPDAAEAYAEALVETVAFLSQARPVLPVSASGIGQAHRLKRRLTMIMRGTTPKALSRVGIFSVLGVGAVLLALVPTGAEQAPRQKRGALASNEEKPAPQKATGQPRGSTEGRPRSDLVAEARDEVELAKAQLDSKRAELQEVRVRLKQAKREVEYQLELKNKNLVSHREVDRSRAEVEALEARLGGKEAQYREIEVRLRQAQRRLAGLQLGGDGREGPGPDVRKAVEPEPATEAGAIFYQGKPTRYWIQKLKDRDPTYRQQALQALEAIGRDDPSVVPALLESLKDRDGEIRFKTARILCDLGPLAKSAAPALIEALRLKGGAFYGDVRPLAAKMLGEIGPDAKKAVPALLEMLKDEDAEARKEARDALKKIDPKEAEKTGASSGKATGADVLTINQRNFKIPFQVPVLDSRQKPALRAVILFVSTDQGRTWREAAITNADADAFSFYAPADGEYWFSICFVDKEGNRQPSEINKARAELKVLVKTP
jgi:beta-lactamase regulating signal transducer with metallopeptidase domain